MERKSFSFYLHLLTIVILYSEFAKVIRRVNRTAIYVVVYRPIVVITVVNGVNHYLLIFDADIMSN